MKYGPFGLSTYVWGVLMFFAGMYGVGQGASLYISCAGLGFILIGLVMGGIASRFIARTKPNILTLALALAGLGVYVSFGRQAFTSLSPWGVLWALLPYLVCIAVSCFVPLHKVVVAAGVVLLLFDAYVAYSVLHSSDATAGLALVYAPIWSTLVLVPVSVVVGWRFSIGRNVVKVI